MWVLSALGYCSRYVYTQIVHIRFYLCVTFVKNILIRAWLTKQPSEYRTPNSLSVINQQMASIWGETISWLLFAYPSCSNNKPPLLRFVRKLLNAWGFLCCWSDKKHKENSRGLLGARRKCLVHSSLTSDIQEIKCLKCSNLANANYGTPIYIRWRI